MTVALTQAVIEIERHVASLGWDQPARLYALVDTHALAEAEPGLAEELGLTADDGAPGSLTPIEQEDVPEDVSIDDFLAGIAWPDAVVGCALVIERLMLPPDAEADAPASGSAADLDDWVARHPERQELRMAVGVLRDGSRETALRLRTRDEDTEVLSGSELVPGLADALFATFEA